MREAGVRTWGEPRNLRENWLPSGAVEVTSSGKDA